MDAFCHNRRIVIIGAGMSGIAMGIQLLKKGHTNFIIYEKYDSIGGTWYENTYPDCGCDVPTTLYNFSFELYPEWDRLWAKQPQILAYLRHVVKKYDLAQYIQLNTTVKECVWKDELWHVQLYHNEKHTTIKTAFLVSACGPLNIPAFPKIANINISTGENAFGGEWVHSARWRSDLNLENKTVGIIGTGASAIQIIPSIAKQVKKLYVFQRTPPWIGMKFDAPIPHFVKQLFRIFPFLMLLLRIITYIFMECQFFAWFKNSFVQSAFRHLCTSYIKSQVRDPHLLAKVLPNYPPGCKRVCVSSEWYSSLCRDNVEVVTDKLIAVQPSGLEVQQAETTSTIPLDVIIFATGFQVTREAPPPSLKYDIIGRNNTSLLHSQPQAYLGITAANFPNLFLLLGPNTGLGHNSVVLMIECQVNYILKLLAQVPENVASIEVKKQKQEDFLSYCRNDFANKVWTSCVSWYQMPTAESTSERNKDRDTADIFALWPSWVM